MTRRAHKPTDQLRTMVRRLSGLGTSVDDIGRLTEISDVTVRKYYMADLERGRAEANTRVAQSLFKAATRENNPNVIAAMFWLKNRAGWKALAATDTLPLGDNIDTLRIEFVRASATPDVSARTINGSAEPIDTAVQSPRVIEITMGEDEDGNEEVSETPSP